MSPCRWCQQHQWRKAPDCISAISATKSTGLHIKETKSRGKNDDSMWMKSFMHGYARVYARVYARFHIPHKPQVGKPWRLNDCISRWHVTGLAHRPPTCGFARYLFFKKVFLLYLVVKTRTIFTASELHQWSFETHSQTQHESGDSHLPSALAEINFNIPTITFPQSLFPEPLSYGVQLNTDKPTPFSINNWHWTVCTIHEWRTTHNFWKFKKFWRSGTKL